MAPSNHRKPFGGAISLSALAYRTIALITQGAGIITALPVMTSATVSFRAQQQFALPDSRNRHKPPISDELLRSLMLRNPEHAQGRSTVRMNVRNRHLT